MHTNLNQTAFARNALVLFLVGAFFIFVFEIAEKQGVISDLSENIGRLAVWLVLLGVVAVVARRTVLDRPVWRAGFVCGSCILVGLVLGVTKEIPALDPVPLIGHDSEARQFIGKVLVCGWTSAVLFLFFYLARSLEGRQKELELEISQKTHALEQLQRAEAQVVQRERLSALGQMASGIAHDLNNALTPVVTYCELLRSESVPPEERAKMMEVVMQGAFQAAGVVKQLQFFYGNSQEVVGFGRVDLVQLVQETISLTKPRWHDDAVHRGKDITIRAELPDTVTVRGNATELKQVLTNLLFNAEAAISKRGTIEIRVTTAADSVSIEVTDDGVGMPEDVRKQCFEPYFSRTVDGSGLGLSVCHGIIKRHGGKIEVESEQGVGTKFLIRLPCRIKNEHTAPLSPQVGGRLPRVLYIDDEKSVRDSTARLIKVLGAEVDLAEDGPAGLSLLTKQSYQIVMTDLGMAGMSGDQVVKAVKHYDPNMPVVVISGWSAANVARAFRGTLQPDHVIQKPITMDTMASTLASFSSLGRPGPAGPN